MSPTAEERERMQAPDAVNDQTVMTDFALATELLDTQAWFLGAHPTARVHHDRLSRAVRFLMGQRNNPDLCADSLRRLQYNDPTIAAVRQQAFAEGAEQMRKQLTTCKCGNTLGTGLCQYCDLTHKRPPVPEIKHLIASALADQAREVAYQEHWKKVEGR